MGMCKPSGGKFDVYGPFGRNIKLIRDGIPNSRTDYYDENTGKLLQQRWYDANGDAIWDRDWDHGNGNGSHKFPHDHYWNFQKPQDPRPKYVGPDDENTNLDFC